MPRRLHWMQVWPGKGGPGGGGLEGDLKADALEAPREALRRAFGIAPVVDIAACFPVYAAVANNVVSRHQNAIAMLVHRRNSKIASTYSTCCSPTDRNQPPRCRTMWMSKKTWPLKRRVTRDYSDAEGIARPSESRARQLAPSESRISRTNPISAARQTEPSRTFCFSCPNSSGSGKLASFVFVSARNWFQIGFRHLGRSAFWKIVFLPNEPNLTTENYGRAAASGNCLDSPTNSASRTKQSRGADTRGYRAPIFRGACGSLAPHRYTRIS